MRLLEIIIRDEDRPRYDSILEREEMIDKWTYVSENDRTVIKVLTHDRFAKGLMEELENLPHERVVIYPIEGTTPKPRISDKSDSIINFGKFFTIGKIELYEDIQQPVDLSVNFIVMLILSSFVAGIGILQDSEPIIIGAMVIAPFLGPNMALAFGTTLGDWNIIKKSIIAGTIATVIAISISTMWGLLSEGVGHVSRDHDIEYQDIALALISGFAGVIAMISGRGSQMVGVMVAVALLPPIMRSGLFLGSGYYADSLNSFLIFSVNIVCINIAGIITFNIAGIRPRRWWERGQAKKHIRTAFLLWTLALVILVGAILFMEHFR